MLDARPIESVEVLEYKQGEIIVREGEPSRYFYAILQGEVQIYQMDKPIRILTDQDVFGLENYYCLLYTSDAADDLLCVDLGGRRIIKKKNIKSITSMRFIH